ncbi:hypothetical protein FOPE_10781 [Fonsecaea pedrosoi]|nr:hypothetical protein FOPE_10781 [Fonsecaea pedrosoi]
MQVVSAYQTIADCYERAPMSLEIDSLEDGVQEERQPHITAGLIIDPCATSADCRAATAVMVIRSGVHIRPTLGTYGMSFIVGLRPIRFKLTPAGVGTPDPDMKTENYTQSLIGGTTYSPACTVALAKVSKLYGGEERGTVILDVVT